MQDILIVRATSTGGDEEGFVRLRARLINDPVSKDKIPDFLRTCRNLGQFWAYIRDRASTYAGRRKVIWEEFTPLLDFAENQLPSSEPAMTAPARTIKCHCPKCGEDRKAVVRGEYRQSSSEEVNGGRNSIEFSETYRILECGGCETLFCQRVLWCSEGGDYFDSDSQYERTYWPSTAKWQPPKWMEAEIDQDLHHILVEVYAAINNGMPVLAAIGIRTAFDRATELLKIDTALPFKTKLDELVKQGMLGAGDRAALAALVDAGSAAAHRGWKPDEPALLTMIRILETFLNKEFVLKAGLDQLVSSIPARRN